MVKQGHDVTMLTSLPDYSSGKVPRDYKFFKNREEYINGVHVLRVPIIARRTGVIWRALNYLSFMFTSSIKTRFIRTDIDVIFSYQTSPIMMAHAAVKMKKRSKRKLVLYCLDLWPESLKAWGVKETSLLFRIMKRYSSWIYGKCDIVAISSKPFKKYLVENCNVEASRIKYLPQHADEIARSIGSGNKDCVNIAFGGNIGKVQDVECIIRAVYRLRDIEGYTVHIYGNGSRYSECCDLAKELGVENKVIFHGRVSKKQLLAEYRDMDVFLLTLKQAGFIGMTAPTKLQEYMSMGKPIIAAINGAAADIISEARCGLVCNASNDELLARCIEEYINNPDKYSDLGDNGYRFYRQNFTRMIFMERLMQLLSTCVINDV